MGRTIQRSLIVAAIVTFLAGCGVEKTSTITLPAGPSAGKPSVYTVNYPLTWFAERLAGGKADVVFLAPLDEDPAFWQPSDDEIAGFQSATLILRNGATYAKWADKVSLPASTQVDTSKAFSSDFITIEADSSHSHGSDGEHSHAGTAFTTWMDLQQAIWQAEEVRDALIGQFPAEKAAIESNFESLADELDAIHQELKSIGEAFGDTPLVASHPVYQYFARGYGLNLKSVLWEPETAPDAEAMKELQKLLVEHPAKLMIWEGAPAVKSVELLKDLGIESVVVDPCGNRPGDGEDFLSIMRANVANLKKAAGLE